jgi:Tol biopolymer transport system component
MALNRMLLATAVLVVAIASAHAWANTSQQMVFMTPTASGQSVPSPSNTAYEIAIMNLDGSGFRQLTHDGKFKFLPHFSPDASKIIYAKFSVGGYGSPDAAFDVAVYDLASGQETLITHDGHDINGIWSPDGTHVAYLATAFVPAESVHDSTIWIVDADGSNPRKVASASGGADDLTWGDLAWSSQDWLLFSAAQNVNGCFKVRLDKIRPDGSERTQVTDGGPNCTPPGMEQSGDADPGFSADGATIYSSRGFPVPPAGQTAPVTERKLYAFSSGAWTPGKVEQDLSLPSQPSCIEGVPKGSADGKRVLLFRFCFDSGTPKGGIYVTDATGSYRTFVADGFGPDWNPTASDHATGFSHFAAAANGRVQAAADATACRPRPGPMPAACAPPFSNPVAVTITGYTGDAMEPFISENGQYLFFNSRNDPAINTDIYYASRIDDHTFLFLGPVAGANSPLLDAVSSLDTLGNFYFVSTRSYATTLSTIYSGQLVPGSIVNVAIVPGISLQQSGSVNFDAEISADGQTLWFDDGLYSPSGDLLAASLVVADRQGSGFVRRANSAALLATVNAVGFNYAPSISVDGLELFFTRYNLTTSGALPAIYRATRTNANLPFGTPELVTAATGYVEAPSLSADGHLLYFHKWINGTFVVYVAQR